MKKFCTLFAMMAMFALTSQAEYYMVGDAPFGGWNPGAGVEMSQNTDGTYSYRATISGTVYFVFSDGLNSDWSVFNSEYRYGPANGNEIVNVDTWYTTQKAGDNGAYQFVGTGDEYVFTFNPFIKKFKIEGHVGEIVIDTYTVAGTPATVFGTEWDQNNTDNDMLKLEDGTYMLQKFGCELGGEVAFKVVGNHDWGFAWPSENMIIPIEQSGVYDITFTFNPETNEVGYNLQQSGSLDVRTGDLFILGEVNGNGWDPSNGLKMDTEDQNIFTAQITTAGENNDETDGVGYSFFSFTTKLGENSEDWGSIGAYRIGALEDGYLLSEEMMGIEIGMGNFGSTYSFKVPAGTYDLTVNLDNKTMMINKASEQPEEGYKIEKIWEVADLSTVMNTADVRQGFGMNSKFYINDKANQSVLVFSKNGLTNTTYPGGANCGITRDEAGNLVVSNATFPDAWSAEATIKVINPETNEMKEYTVPSECGLDGRCDFIGFAKGNLMEDGWLYLAGANNSGVAVMSIAGGEVYTDDCFAATCDGLTPSSSTVINYYTDLAGEDALLYVTRNAAPMKLVADGDNLAGTSFTLPNKGACNGAFAFVWDEKEFFVYPTLPNYLDGFAIAEAGAEAPIVEVAPTAAANANTFTSNWLNAEVDEMGVTIYQYYPGGHMTTYRLTKNTGGVEEIVNNIDKVVAGVRYYNIMGQEMKEANGLTIVVTTYTDGSHSAIKVIK